MQARPDDKERFVGTLTEWARILATSSFSANAVPGLGNGFVPNTGPVWS
jgi:hypothetical protein